jgi:hypothetical protein
MRSDVDRDSGRPEIVAALRDRGKASAADEE